MRFFLSLLLLDMTLRSFAALVPWRDWADELKVQRSPRRLPTHEERVQLSTQAPGNAPVVNRMRESFEDMRSYWNPWPKSESIERMEKWYDPPRYAACWATSRLGFLEMLWHAPQGWSMFSPNVGKWDEVIRVRLHYADGDMKVVRMRAEPTSLTSYGEFRFFSEKHLQYSTRVDTDADARLGLCNLMIHRHQVNAAGSPLVRLELVKVRFDYPPPGEETKAFLARQETPLGAEQSAAYFVFDVVTSAHMLLE